MEEIFNVTYLITARISTRIEDAAVQVQLGRCEGAYHTTSVTLYQFGLINKVLVFLVQTIDLSNHRLYKQRPLG